MKKQRLEIVNARGEKEFFSWNKVYRSARRVGASPVLARKIADQISEEVYPGISTIKIFQEVRRLLKKESPSLSFKFSLKEGMRKLGPTGFPFEKYISKVLDKNGFNTEINLHLRGKCAFYEIDFLARKENILYVGECKYHHLPGERVDLQVALYNYARFLDLKNGEYFQEPQFSALKIKPMLVTNTKFTSQVRRYSRCVGVELLGWNHPKNKGLEYIIEKEKLYPITVLPSFRGYLKDIFFRNRIVLASDLISFDIKRLSRKLGVPIKSIYPLVNEAKMLLEQ